LVEFTLPGSTDAAHWLLLIDTNQPTDLVKTAFAPGEVYQVTGRSLLMFSMEAETEQAKDLAKPDSAVDSARAKQDPER